MRTSMRLLQSASIVIQYSDLIEYVYRLISCKPDEFDSLEAQLKSDMDNAGLTDIIEGRAALYDEEMAAAE